MKKIIQFYFSLLIVIAFANTANADCPTSLLCNSYDYSLPVKISTSTGPALTVVGGDVGIGITSPAANLHVAGSYGSAPGAANTAELTLESTATAGVGIGPILQFGGQTGNAAPRYTFAAIKGMKNASGATDYSGALGFYTQDASGASTLAERMRIDQAGNVGIGTASPSEKLQLQSGWIYTPYTANQTDGYKLGLGNTTGHIWRNYAGGTHGAGLISDSLVFSNNWVLNNSGADVVPNAGNPTTAMVLGKASIYFATGTIGTAPSAKMIITSGGNVGLGTITPGVRLDVNGQANVAGNFLGFRPSGTTINGSNYAVYGDSSGNTILNQPDNGTIAMRFNNSNTCTLTNGSSWSCTSDERLKTSVEDLTSASGLDAIMKLQPVTFRWRDVKTDSAAGGKQMGFLAQQVEQIFPMLVKTGAPTTINLPNGTRETIEGTKSVQYSAIVVPLVKAVQEQQAEINQLKAALCELKPDSKICR